MAINKKTRRYTSRYVEESNPSKKLFKLVVVIIFLASLLVFSVSTFAPKLGALFGLLSIYRNQQENEIEAAIQPPIFTDTKESTNSKSIDIKGIAEPTTTVELYVNGPKHNSVIADAAGEFIFTDVKLISGKNTLFAKAKKNDLESEKSDILNILVDMEAPKVDIEDPKDGETVRNLNKSISIKGTVNEKATIRVNGRTAVLNPDLAFEFLLGVDEGNVKIEVEATDPAGNKTTKTINVKYEKRGV